MFAPYLDVTILLFSIYTKINLWLCCVASALTFAVQKALLESHKLLFSNVKGLCSNQNFTWKYQRMVQTLSMWYKWQHLRRWPWNPQSPLPDIFGVFFGRLKRRWWFVLKKYWEEIGQNCSKTASYPTKPQLCRNIKCKKCSVFDLTKISRWTWRHWSQVWMNMETQVAQRSYQVTMGNGPVLTTRPFSKPLVCLD